MKWILAVLLLPVVAFALLVLLDLLFDLGEGIDTRGVT